MRGGRHGRVVVRVGLHVRADWHICGRRGEDIGWCGRGCEDTCRPALVGSHGYGAGAALFGMAVSAAARAKNGNITFDYAWPPPLLQTAYYKY